jgi:hypothetical protein
MTADLTPIAIAKPADRRRLQDRMPGPVRARRTDEATREPGRAGRAGAAAPHRPRHHYGEDHVIVNALAAGPVIEHADALDWLPAREPDAATAVIYDPPYAVGSPVRGREDGAAGSVSGPLSFMRTGSRAQASGAVCRGTLAIRQRLDCLKPSLQKVETRARRKDSRNRCRPPPPAPAVSRYPSGAAARPTGRSRCGCRRTTAGEVPLAGSFSVGLFPGPGKAVACSPPGDQACDMAAVAWQLGSFAQPDDRPQRWLGLLNCGNVRQFVYRSVLRPGTFLT